MAEPVIKFRNYAPRDTALAANAAPPLVPSAADAAAAAAAVPAAPEPSDAPVLLVAQKANWDLKRDLAPKLELLAKMTQRAIGEVVAARAAGAAGAAAGGGGGGGGGASSSGGAPAPSAAQAPAARAGGAALDEVYRGPLDPALLARGKEEHLDE